jgi:hypothetical protein
MPKVFTTIDRAMRMHFDDRRCDEALGFSKPGTIRCLHDLKVASQRFAPAGTSSTCHFRGKLDALIEFDDGDWAVIDFKTSQASEANHNLYARQLHAYAYALENPADGMPLRAPVTFIGLIYFDPNTFALNDATATLTGRAALHEVPRDDSAFESFVAEMLGVLDQDVPPEANSSCDWCQYREQARRMHY